MIEVTSHLKPFKTDMFNCEFSRLFEENGPLTYILRNYPIVPAKGGSKFNEYKDTTYFMHVLNVSYIGAIFLENDLIKRLKSNILPESYREYIKIFFSSSILHDFNKLEGSHIWKGKEYKELIENKQQIIIKIISPYFGSNKDINRIFDQIKYTVMNVENGSKDLMNNMNVDDKDVLYFMADYIHIGDSLSSLLSRNIDEYSIVDKIIEQFNEKGINNMYFIHFHKIPQTILRNYIIQYTEEFYSKNNNIIIKSPDWIILDTEIEYPKLTEYIKTKILSSLENLDNIILKYPPSSNQINTSFSNEITVTQEVLEKFMDMYKERLLLYQKFADLDKKYGIINTLEKWGFDIDKRNKVKYFKDSEDEFDADITLKSRYVKTAILRRIELDKASINTQQEEELLKNSGIDIDKIEKITYKTLVALAYAKINREEINTVYPEIMQRVCELLNKDKKETSLDKNINILISNTLSQDFEIKQDIQSKEELCIQCGGYLNNKEITRIESFGINATSGTGIKISSIEYGKYNGKICQLCTLENSIRKQEFGDKKSFCIQVYIGDYLPPVNLTQIITHFKISLANPNTDGENKTYSIKLSSNQQIPVIGYHNIGFVEKPENKISEFYYIQKALTLIQNTGIKIEFTNLFISGESLYYMFKWESPPGWIKEFSLDKIRIDELSDGIYKLKTITELSNIGRGYKDIPSIISELMNNKMNIYSIIWNGISAQKNKEVSIRKFLFGNEDFEGIRKYEEMYDMSENRKKVEELVDSACDIVNNKGPTTNNDNTWIIRSAFSIFEENKKNKDGKLNNDYDDIKGKIAGLLFEAAERQNKFSGEQVKNACIKFSNDFVDYILEKYSKLPRQNIRRDIIAQFGLLYNIKKWQKIKDEKNEKKNVEVN